MKLLENPNKIIKIGEVGEEQVFHLAATSAAFDILSSNIYLYPIRACVREYSCNARDAQVYVGNDPSGFQVHLPSNYYPHFSVRDFGPGLDEIGIKELFTTYFNSNKIKSNDFIGAFGLGSKSAYNVCDNFSVTSWFGGIKYRYALFKNDEGKPAYTLISKQESNEPNGLEIQIPVKSNEIYTFETEAVEFFKYWDKLPKFVGTKQPNIRQDTPNLKGSNWYTTEKYTPYQKFSGKVLMGSVNYPFQITELKNVGETAKKLYYCGLVIRLPIGAVQVPASREELRYHKTTIARLEQEMDKIETEYAAMVQKEIDAAPHYYAACELAHKMPIVPNRAKYQGKQLEFSQSINLTKTLYRFRPKSYGKVKAYEDHYTGGQTMSIGFLNRVFEKDIDLTSHARAIEEVARTGLDVWLIDPDDIKELCTKFGYPENQIKKVSNLNYTKNTKINSKVTGIYYLQGSPWSYSWRQSSIDFKTDPTGYYIGFFDKNIYGDKIKSRHMGPNQYTYIDKYLETIGIVPGKVYGVQRDKMPRFEKQGWTNLIDKVESDIDAALLDDEFTQYCNFITFFLDTHVEKFIKTLENYTDSNSIVLKYFKNHYSECLKSHIKNEKRFGALVEADKMFFGKMAVQSYKELTKKFEAVLKEYDLLGVLIGSKVDPERILRYVKETDYIKKGTI